MVNISLQIIFLNSDGERGKEKIENVRKEETMGRLLESARNKLNIKSDTTLVARLRSKHYRDGLELGSEWFVPQNEYHK